MPPDPAAMIERLIATVAGFDLEPGTETALVSKLRAALKSVARDHDNAACGQLQAFINQMNAQKMAPHRELSQNPAEADQLIAAANDIRVALECR